MDASACKWIYVVRHGESQGNVANVLAREYGTDVIDVDPNDRNVPLSQRGIEQAHALGLAYVKRPPTAVWTSPYRRAYQTAEIAAQEWRSPTPLFVDERLRERALGVLNGLTSAGVQSRFPQEAASRARVGKFHYRPPEGESWADVTQRLTSVVEDLIASPDQRIMLVTHQVIVLCMRYVIEQLSIEELMSIDAASDVANCSVTTYAIKDGRFKLEVFNDVSALEKLAAPVTEANDAADVG